jgi:hypothetical protein
LITVKGRPEAMTNEINEAIDRLAASARYSEVAKGLRRMADSSEDTWLNDVATKYYQDGATEVAKVIEMMIAAGKIIPAETNRWWPSALAKLSALDFQGYEVKDNPPRLITRNAKTGNTGTKEIPAPTQEAVNAAIKELAAEMKARDKESRKRRQAEREVNAE